MTALVLIAKKQMDGVGSFPGEGNGADSVLERCQRAGDQREGLSNQENCQSAQATYGRLGKGKSVHIQEGGFL